jgi:mannose-6-phosphate isomerase
MQQLRSNTGMTIKYKLNEQCERPWGTWKVTAVGKDFIEKEIRVNPGEILSLQRHNHRAEIWTILQGIGRVTLGDKKIDVKVGDIIHIPVGAWHRVENIGKQLLVKHEKQTGEILDENDIERRDDKYNRS